MILLEAQQLNIFTNKNKKLITGPLSLSLKTSEVLVIQGKNGSGKTTLLKSLVGLHDTYKGKITKNIPTDEISYLPQLSGLSFMLPLQLKDILSFDDVGTTYFNIDKDRFWNSASGGERQKTLLNLCLQKKAKLYILDEPFNHLDTPSKEKLTSLIHERIESGSSFIIVSHEALKNIHNANYYNLDKLND